MSFTDAEDAILGWEPIGAVSDDGSENDTWAALQNQNYIADDVRHLYEKIIELQEEIAPWASKKVDDVDALDELALHDIEAFQTLYYQQTESYQAVKQNSQDILGDERSHVMEAIKDVEVLGAKLEYEINALVSKVQDVEDGTAQFERMVEELESRADELEIQLSTESWIHWLVRSMTGIGTGPNITARGRAIQARRVQ
jgi:chromosome segregation ATPase